jgi:hypothetical protein
MRGTLDNDEVNALRHEREAGKGADSANTLYWRHPAFNHNPKKLPCKKK